MRKKQFAVVGLGRFGSSVARTLSEMGHEVLAIDASEERVQDLSNEVTYAATADSTDEEAMRALGIGNFDVVVVAIGEDIQASILTTLIVKEIGVRQVVVKAQDELHGKVLHKIGADKVVYPERDMGMRVAHHLIMPNIIDFIELSEDYGIVEFRAPEGMVGRSLKELDIRAKYGCSVMAIKTNNRMNISPNADASIRRDDVLVVVGRNKDLMRLETAYASGLKAGQR